MFETVVLHWKNKPMENKLCVGLFLFFDFIFSPDRGRNATVGFISKGFPEDCLTARDLNARVVTRF
jgi:hypothetical protein